MAASAAAAAAIPETIMLLEAELDDGDGEEVWHDGQEGWGSGLLALLLPEHRGQLYVALGVHVLVVVLLVSVGVGGVGGCGGKGELSWCVGRVGFGSTCNEPLV